MGPRMEGEGGGSIPKFSMQISFSTSAMLASLKLTAEKTSMHSSRMRTARLLPVSPSMYCSRKWDACSQQVSAPGGVCSWGSFCSQGCLFLGVSVSGGCLLPVWCLLPGGVCSRWGVCSWGCQPRHPLPVDRILDTCF